VNSFNGAGHPGAARDDRTRRPRYRGPGQLRQWLLWQWFVVGTL